MADADFTLPSNVQDIIRAMDAFSQHGNDNISGLAQAISKLSNDQTIITLARHIDYLAQEAMNEINAAAERLGADYKEASHV